MTHETRRGQGVFLSSSECLELIDAAEGLYDEAVDKQRHADEKGYAEDYCAEEFAEIVRKLKHGAGV